MAPAKRRIHCLPLPLPWPWDKVFEELDQTFKAQKARGVIKLKPYSTRRIRLARPNKWGRGYLRPILEEKSDSDEEEEGVEDDNLFLWEEEDDFFLCASNPDLFDSDEPSDSESSETGSLRQTRSDANPPESDNSFLSIATTVDARVPLECYFHSSRPLDIKCSESNLSLVPTNTATGTDACWACEIEADSDSDLVRWLGTQLLVDTGYEECVSWPSGKRS
ncbi:hypothetical protein K438DRAFT_1783826 [Mycena galopus ATCC 62051]|nr:hypothetical protein K438DRAFT_1783826 [Mycena galopus ATCC 62051]